MIVIGTIMTPIFVDPQLQNPIGSKRSHPDIWEQQLAKNKYNEGNAHAVL